MNLEVLNDTVVTIGGPDGPTAVYLSDTAPTIPIWIYFLIVAGVVAAMLAATLVGMAVVARKNNKN